MHCSVAALHGKRVADQITDVTLDKALSALGPSPSIWDCSQLSEDYIRIHSKMSFSCAALLKISD